LLEKAHTDYGPIRGCGKLPTFVLCRKGSGMRNIFDTKTASFQELLGNAKKYRIPEFQRDFSWTEENWEDLWQDIIAVYEDEDPQHYMGAIVLQNTQDKKTFIVVDGQQRITTLSLFILAIAKHIKDLVEGGRDVEANKERLEKILDTYTGEKSLSDLYRKSKLTLNENNNSFYQSRLLEFKEPESYAKLRDSEKLLYNAYGYFYKKIDEYFGTISGEKLGGFLEKVLDGLVFIQITVDDDVSAYTVFETLNARGVELTTTDLLKNYLFAIVARLGKSGSEFKILKENWQGIIDTVGSRRFPVFLRFYLNSRQDIVRKERLFKEIKRQVRDARGALELIDELKKTAYLYAAILNPEDEYWSEYPHQQEIRRCLSELKLFGVTQPIPLIFAVNDLKKEWLVKLLKILVSISFRYNVIGKKNPNELEKVYNKISKGMYNGEVTGFAEVKDMLRVVYVDDETFVGSFKNKEITTSGKGKRIVKYILIKIENHLSSRDYSYDDATITIEHILPESFDENWDRQFSNEADKYKHRLGNYTLLEAKKNRRLAGKSFDEKRKVYATSQFRLAKDELNYDEWNISNLNDYQAKLARYAKSIWKI